MSGPIDRARMLDVAPVAILAVDLNGRVLEHNGKASAWMSPAEARAANVSSV